MKKFSELSEKYPEYADIFEVFDTVYKTNCYKGFLTGKDIVNELLNRDIWNLKAEGKELLEQSKRLSDVGEILEKENFIEMGFADVKVTDETTTPPTGVLLTETFNKDLSGDCCVHVQSRAYISIALLYKVLHHEEAPVKPKSLFKRIVTLDF